jgi:hypothetical protein
LKVIAMSLPDRERNDNDAQRQEVPIAPHGADGTEEAALAAGRSPRRLLTIWGEKVIMTLVIVAATMGLTRFATHVSRQAQGLAPDGGPGAGTVIRTEVLHLWLPQTLLEQAKHRPLQQFLERQGQEKLWYALTTRGHQQNGGFADITMIRRPCDDPPHLSELLDILATAGGNPPSDPNLDYSKAAVHIIAEEMANREPREVIAELLGHRSPAVDQVRSP